MATKKAPAKPSGVTAATETTKARAAARRRLNTLVKEFRSNPAAYTEIREHFLRAETDAERAAVLVDFATSGKGFGQMVPSGGTNVAAATVTTVTITTVTWPSSAY